MKGKGRNRAWADYKRPFVLSHPLILMRPSFDRLGHSGHNLLSRLFYPSVDIQKLDPKFPLSKPEKVI